jgi:hypothetical protein
MQTSPRYHLDRTGDTKLLWKLWWRKKLQHPYRDLNQGCSAHFKSPYRLACLKCAGACYGLPLLLNNTYVA